jgi:hypothetical protein
MHGSIKANVKRMSEFGGPGGVDFLLQFPGNIRIVKQMLGTNLSGLRSHPA